MPMVDEFTFVMRNIVVNSYGSYVLRFLTSGQFVGLQLQNGIVNYSDGITHLSTYNTGEAFDVSGSYYRNVSNSGNIFSLYVRGINYVTTGLVRCPLDSIQIAATTATGTISLDLSINSSPINYTLAFPNTLQVGGVVTGSLSCDIGTRVYGDTIQFFNSFESLLTGGKFVAEMEANTVYPFVLGDNDTSSQNNQLDFDITLKTIDPNPIETLSIRRTGLYDGSLTQLTDYNANNVISTQFDGVWTGNRRFVYNDTPQSRTLTYSLFKMDSIGQLMGDTITYAFSGASPTNGQSFVSEYVTGFNLTSSGEYTAPPSVIFTGYYYVTGLQQPLISMLFSSGCSGNLNISFVRNSIFGSGASGTLNTRLVQFQDVYGVGVNYFYTIDSFNLISGGTGYGVPPRAVVNTGAYGTGCYDVVVKSGVNLAWFLPFNTSGGLNPSASYLTGEVLFNTGLVSGGLYSGYVVTGFNLTNPGSGYNATYRPLMRFVRQTGDPLTGRAATGVLTTKATGTYNFNSIWRLDTGFAGYTLSSGAFNGTMVVPAEQHYLSFRVTSSGLDNTAPIVTALTLTSSAGSGITQYITGYKTYSTDTGFLKKKLNVTGRFQPGQPLSFLTTQSELDTFYSSAGYTNNNFGIDLGDLDF